MARGVSDALGRQVGFRETPMTDVKRRSRDMAAMWEFLRGPGYQADIDALRRDYPAVGWTSFTEWAHRTLQPGAQAAPGGV
jgi:hypothetical protein